MSEIQLQQQCYVFTWNQHPETRRCLFHVPNGGKRSKIEASQLKASGVVSGVPDLLFVWGGKLHAFELKTEIGVVSDAQKAVHKAWLEQGVIVHVVRSFEDFKKIFLKILGE